MFKWGFLIGALALSACVYGGSDGTANVLSPMDPPSSSMDDPTDPSDTQGKPKNEKVKFAADVDAAAEESSASAMDGAPSHQSGDGGPHSAIRTVSMSAESDNGEGSQEGTASSSQSDGGDAGNGDATAGSTTQTGTGFGNGSSGGGPATAQSTSVGSQGDAGGSTGRKANWCDGLCGLWQCGQKPYCPGKIYNNSCVTASDCVVAAAANCEAVWVIGINVNETNFPQGQGPLCPGNQCTTPISELPIYAQDCRVSYDMARIGMDCVQGSCKTFVK